MIGGRMEKAWGKAGTEGEAACCGMWAPLRLAFQHLQDQLPPTVPSNKPPNNLKKKIYIYR